jgi:multidrug resistance efflux pump
MTCWSPRHLQVAMSNVPAIEAQLDGARFNLAQCRMMTPTDGYVVNWQVQACSCPHRSRRLEWFVNTSDMG